MAANLIKLDEAAKMLGITSDELVELRSAGEIHGYRDGASWKFKMDEIKRLAEEKGIKLDSGSGLKLGGSSIDLTEDGSSLADLGMEDSSSGSSLIMDDDDNEVDDLAAASGESEIDQLLDDHVSPSDDEDIESILVNEESSAEGGKSPSSTVIGKNKKADGDSDLQVEGDSSDLGLGSDSSLDSDVELVPDAEGSGVNLVAGGSDVLATDSDVLSGEGSGTGSTGGGSSTGSGASDTGKLLVGEGEGLDDDLDMALGSELTLGEADSEAEGVEAADASEELSELEQLSDLALDEAGPEDEEDVDLTLQASSSVGSIVDDESEPVASDLSLDSGLGGEMGDDSDDMDLLLAGSGAGSDLSLGTDSGINLSPTDSGLSLEEEPLDLGGSSVEQLEIPADADDQTQMKADDEFLLTPVEEADDESSGSQVIALEDSEVYADDAMEGEGTPALVAEGEEGAADPGVHPMPSPAARGMREAPYSLWNVLSLLLIFVLLVMSGTFMWDLLRNLWEFDQPVSATTSMADTLIKFMGLTP